MYNEISQKLLEHFYEIVPGRESFAQLSRAVFPNENNPPLNELLKDFLSKGYIYKWENDPEEQSDEFGMTPQGILYYDGHVGEMTAAVAVAAPVQMPVAEPVAVSPVVSDENSGQTFSLKAVIPIILLIAFAIGLVWYIMHTKA
ncbi:MAG: hypothetical protein JST87_00330 [Bacteroidetes bacterium]|nr:hypothetical protein [Bacteroidota bacterium]MBS1935928.1 hypothetical protein [Bacteroidota bacterium]